VASAPNGATAPLSVTKRPYPGIDAVLEAASRLVTSSAGDERLRGLALQITRSARKHPVTGKPDLRDVDAIAGAIYTWMVRTINYVRDPWDIERLQSPVVTLRQKAGDCDDHAILGAALLGSLGVQTGFRIVSRSGSTFDHIYAVYRSGDQWKSFDTTILKHPGYVFDERLIRASRYVIHSPDRDLGFDPFTAIAAVTSAVSTGLSTKNTLSQLFTAGDKDERQRRSALRNHLMSRGVRSEAISLSHTQNNVLQRYAQLIDELGAPAVEHLNRYGELPASFVAGQRIQHSKRQWILYSSIAGACALLGAVVIHAKRRQTVTP